MKKINLKNWLCYFLIIICICILKGSFIYSMDGHSYSDFVHDLLIFWGDNQLVNLIWLLPILLNLYIIAKNYFYMMLHFDMRFKNRKHFINITLMKCYFSSLLFNFLIAVMQTIFLSLVSGHSIIVNFTLFSFLIRYIIENTFINFIVILLALYIKNFMYAYISFIVFIIINFSLIKENTYLPFFNLFFSNQINSLTILLTIIAIFLIKRVYLHYDIGGI